MRTTPLGRISAVFAAGSRLIVALSLFHASTGAVEPVLRCAEINNESDPATVSCPAGLVFTNVTFASYGLPMGFCGNFGINSTCHSPNSAAIIAWRCLRRSSCTIPNGNGIFGDPCSSVGKRLYVALECGAPRVSCSGAPITSPSFSASASYTGEGRSQYQNAAAAFTGGVWNAGLGSPQWIQVDFGSPVLVQRIRLIVQQMPINGTPQHSVLAGNLDPPSTTIYTSNAFMTNEQELDWPVVSGCYRYVRIYTSQSTSWISWKNIRILPAPEAPCYPVLGRQYSLKVATGLTPGDWRLRHACSVGFIAPVNSSDPNIGANFSFIIEPGVNNVPDTVSFRSVNYPDTWLTINSGDIGARMYILDSSNSSIMRDAMTFHWDPDAALVTGTTLTTHSFPSLYIGWNYNETTWCNIPNFDGIDVEGDEFHDDNVSWTGRHLWTFVASDAAGCGIAPLPRWVATSSGGLTTAARYAPSTGATSGMWTDSVGSTECCSDSFVIDDGSGRPIFEVSSDSCTCHGVSVMESAMTVGADGTPVASIRHLLVEIGASDPPNENVTVGRLSKSFSWGVSYPTASKLRVTAVSRTTSVSSAVYAVTVSSVGQNGAVLNVLRLDRLGAGWNDTALAASVTVTEAV